MPKTSPENRFNRIVRELWSVIVREGLTDGEAWEVVGRLMMSLALSGKGGDPKAAGDEIASFARSMVEALADPEIHVATIVTAKQKERRGPPPRPVRAH